MSFDLRLGDCLDPLTGLKSLPDKSVDHCITDPPYSRDLYLSFRTNAGVRGHVYGRKGQRKARETSAHRQLTSGEIGAADDVAGPVVEQLKRIVRRWIVIFHDAESGHLWREPMDDWHVRCGVWVKPNAVPQISGDRPAQGFESIEIAHNSGAKRWNGGGRPAVWVCNSVNWPERQGNDHPCPKPLELMDRLVRDFTDPGDIVLDPFAGSCTTLVAAIRSGRNVIGWERNEKWYQTGRKRCEATREQFTMFDGTSTQRRVPRNAELLLGPQDSQLRHPASCDSCDE